MYYVEEKAAAEAELKAANEALVVSEASMDDFKRIRELEARVRYFAPRYEVGDGVTLNGYSDRFPFTVIEVSKSGKKIKIRADKAELDPNWKPEINLGGFAGHCVNNREQEWVYSEDPEGRVMEISLRNIKLDPRYNDGLESIEKWVPVGEKAKIGSNPISPGRARFHDYNF